MDNFSPIEFHKAKHTQLTPELRWDKKSNFEEWSDACRKKLFYLLGLDKMEKCEDDFHILNEETLDCGKHIHFAVQTELGYYAHCHLLIPHEFEGKLPLCACLQGHLSGAHLSLGKERGPHDKEYLEKDGVDFCVQAVKNGYIGLAIEQRAFGENAGNEVLIGTNCQHVALGAILLGRTLIGERVWDVQRVVDSVLSRFADIITMEKSILVGMSGGGTATYYTACFDHRFEVFVPGVAICTFKDSIVDMCHCSCNYIPSIATYFDMSDLAVMIAPKKLVVMSATEDDYFPIDGALKEYERIKDIYEAVGAKEMCKQVIGKGPHSFYVDIGWKAINELLKKQ